MQKVIALKSIMPCRRHDAGATPCHTASYRSILELLK
jgi:hypothetical protein